MPNNLSNVTVKIVLPNYNSAAYVSETIDSVINQTFKNWKLTIIDDNSNIETQKVLKNYTDHPNINIIWLKKNKRSGFCRNLAIRNSKSDYIAFIDSDDIWEEEKLSKQLDFMIKNKYYFTYTNYLTFIFNDKHSNSKRVIPEKYFTFKKFIRSTSIGTSTMIIERSLIGIVKYSDGTVEVNELVGFRPSSEYEFIIDGERLYRVLSNFITIKYEYQGDEEEYNPSWAQSS